MTPLSYRHQKVQRLRRLLQRKSVRETERSFVLEGVNLLEEALRAGVDIETVFCAPGPVPEAVERAHVAGCRVLTLEAGVLERVADTVTPQPVMTIASFVDAPLSDVSDGRPVIVLVDVRDPGNAGTILRSAEASGAGGVVFCDGSVDVYNPKAVRSSAGSLLHVPVVRSITATEAMGQLQARGFRCLATEMGAPLDYDNPELDLSGNIALFFGNEAVGLPQSFSRQLDGSVRIPIEGRSESLNVSMAASVLCFEIARRRRSGS